MNDLDEKDFKSINKEIRERYKMITEVLPPSSDKEHYVAKKDYLNKKQQSKNPK